MSAEVLAAVRVAQRNDAMVYQRDAKERAAHVMGLRFDAFYHLPFAEWSAIRDSA